MAYPSARHSGQPAAELGQLRVARLLLRRLILAGGAIMLVLGVWGGLARMGWALPAARSTMIAGHGALMVLGFFASLIGLERAVALGKRWTYIGPALAVLGAVLAVVDVPWPVPSAVLTLGTAGVALTFGFLALTGRMPHLVVMFGGTLAWFGGTALVLAHQPVFRATPWWLAGFVLVIAGERLELGRFLALRRSARDQFLGLAGALLLSLPLWLIWPGIAARLFGVALIGLAIWLFRYDLARRAIRQRGVHRFSAVCLLAGYAWLASAGFFFLVFGPQTVGLRYDAEVHALTLGFVFSLVFAHAPIIFPAVTGLRYRYLPFAYLPPALLAVTLVVRLAGDLADLPRLRQWGGMGNAVALLLFVLSIATSVRAARTAQSSSAAE